MLLEYFLARKTRTKRPSDKPVPALVGGNGSMYRIITPVVRIRISATWEHYNFCSSGNIKLHEKEKRALPYSSTHRYLGR